MSTYSDKVLSSQYDSTESRESTLAKISAPVINDWLPRERHFHWLDEARQRHRVLWISASAGSGKTYLLASYLTERGLPTLWYQIDTGDADIASFFHYLGLAAQRINPHETLLPVLTPEYLPGLSTFARNFFRELFSRLDTPGVIVLDNYQDAPPEAALHELLGIAVAELPPGLSLAVLSRGEPPASLARERVHGGLGMLGEQELRLDEQELSALAHRYYHTGGLDAAHLRRLNAETQGWFAGVVLLLTRLKTSACTLQGLEESDRAVVFDYFASELFDRSDTTTREFLMKTAYLTPLTAEAAQALTGQDDAAERLERLVRNHHFIVPIGDSRPAYRYHPLFEHFLRSRACDQWSVEALGATCQRAAELAMDAGHFDEAVGLLRDSGAWGALGVLLIEQAPSLMAQGRYQSLAQWLGALPHQYLDQDPWLRYWLGMARLFTEPPEARALLIQAYKQFRAREDGPGQYTAWVAVVNSYLLGLDDFVSLDGWLVEFERLRRCHPDFPSARLECEASVAVFCAKVHRCEYHTDVEAWGDRALALARELSQSSLRIQTLLYRGYYELALKSSSLVLEIIDELGDINRQEVLRPIDQLRSKMIFAIYHRCMLNYDRCRETINEGLRLAESSGVWVLNGMLLGQLGMLTLQTQDLTATKEALARLEEYMEGESLWAQVLYRHLNGMLCQLSHDRSWGLSQLRNNIALHDQLGESIAWVCSQFDMSLLLLQQGQLDEARSCLDQAQHFADAKDATPLRQHCYFARALIAQEEGDEDALVQYLEHGFSTASDFTRYGFLFWSHEMLASVCETALRHDIETEAVQAVIRAYGLTPKATSVDLEQWPWPVRIYTLGRFSVVRDNEPITFGSKAQKRPMELLRALIALGGRGVSVERLGEALWPSAEGDAAAQSLTQTLHRLRRLIGDTAVELSEGRVSLNARHCWVDIWALERRLRHFEELTAEAAIERLESELEEALRLYQGPFLGREADASWVFSVRERLRSRLLTAIQTLARRYGAGGHCRAVRALYEKGLALDDLCEEFYRGLMACHSANGDCGSALRIYERCRQVLETTLGTAPDACTDSLRRIIQEGDNSEAAASCPVCAGRS